MIDFGPLIRWRSSLALDWCGEELVQHVRFALDKMDLNRVPREHWTILAEFRKLPTSDQYAVVAKELGDVDPTDEESEVSKHSLLNDRELRAVAEALRGYAAMQREDIIGVFIKQGSAHYMSSEEIVALSNKLEAAGPVVD